MHPGRLLFFLPLGALALLGAGPDPRTEAVQQARAGDFTRAIPVLEQLAAGGDNAAAADLVAVLAWAGRPADALAAWSSLPADQRPAWVQADAARALAQLGGGLGARDLAGTSDPDLDARAAASLVRLTAVEDRDPARRFAAADRALAELDRQLAAERARPAPDTGLIRRLTLDRWLALRARVHMREIADEFTRWPEPASALPSFALGAAGDALLYLEKPEEARAALTEARRRAPDDQEIALSLFYAHVECEEFTAAYTLIDALAAVQPAGYRYATEGAPRDNPEKLGLVVTAALARYFGDEVRVAWTRLEPLAAAAPGNAYLRREAAAVMAARGWSRRALTELARIEALEPGEPATRLERAGLLLDTRQYAAAETEITALAAAFPENKSAQRLARAWELQLSPEFYASFESETGDSPDVSGGSWRATAELWSPPLARNWRLMAGYTAADADIPEGGIHLDLPVVGLEWRQGAVDLLAQAGQLGSEADSTHARFRARWQATDTWSAELDAAANTPELPLRALYYRLTADTAGAGVAWAPHESRRLSAGVQVARFSSGNRRTEWSAAWRERLFERPHLDVDLTADASLQANSLAGEPYYAPDRARDLGLTLEAAHVLHRRYRSAWVQHAALRAGQRAERGFDSGGIWSLRYELRRDVSDALALTAAGTVGSARYDGIAEKFTRWELTVHGRF